jgi:error-prone DNA polymerase
LAILALQVSENGLPRHNACENFVELNTAAEREEVVFDYAALGVTLRKHPVELLRPLLNKQRLRTAAQLKDLPNGQLVKACGLVTMC